MNSTKTRSSLSMVSLSAFHTSPFFLFFRLHLHFQRVFLYAAVRNMLIQTSSVITLRVDSLLSQWSTHLPVGLFYNKPNWQHYCLFHFWSLSYSRTALRPGSWLTASTNTDCHSLTYQQLMSSFIIRLSCFYRVKSVSP